MNLLTIFRKKTKGKGPETFSDFLLHAPENQREEMFKEAARRANEEQRKVFEQSRMKTPAV